MPPAMDQPVPTVTQHPCGGSRSVGAVVLALVAGAAICHRLEATVTGAALGVAGMAAAAVLVAVRPQGAVALAGLGALLTATIAALRLLGEGWWPCAIACQGGAFYQTILGLPAAALAVGALLAIGGAWWWPAARPALATLLGALAGGALFYLWTAWRLEMVCGYCFAVHTGILTTAILAWPARPRWWTMPVASAVGFAALVAVFGVRLQIDAPQEAGQAVVPAPSATGAVVVPAPVPGAAIHPAPSATWAAVRTIGRPEAPLLVEVAVDIHCPNCALHLNPLLQMLQPQVDAGRARIHLLLMVRPTSRSAPDLIGHLLATGTMPRFRMLLTMLVGLPDGQDWAAVRERVGEVDDPAGIEAAWAAGQTDIKVLMAADNRRLADLGCRQTPFVVLSRQGQEIGRWTAKGFNPAAPVAAVVEAR